MYVITQQENFKSLKIIKDGWFYLELHINLQLQKKSFKKEESCIYFSFLNILLNSHLILKIL